MTDTHTETSAPSKEGMSLNQAAAEVRKLARQFEALPKLAEVADTILNGQKLNTGLQTRIGTLRKEVEAIEARRDKAKEGVKIAEREFEEKAEKFRKDYGVLTRDLSKKLRDKKAEIDAAVEREDARFREALEAGQKREQEVRDGIAALMREKASLEKIVASIRESLQGVGG